ncbi:HIT zinc finger protein [Cardiosporidium cionae]|uniref:HIT zinc finger protein n=1 Tax=Cardiosporidium cionae TaxID=476202 RepID=A0ABQ7JF91_9APIC|nr:HIT zinc finger protein [Cardiosporidium cionae]|eukprot:KAF8822658.1 HIT zinc finger protein [Cardiosporidium cionae]
MREKSSAVDTDILHLRDVHHQRCKKCKPEYVCPRCRITYCSLSCYKDHDPDCVEGFNKDQVEGSLRSLRATQDEKKQFSKILWKLHNLDIDRKEDEEKSDVSNTDNEICEERLDFLLQLAEGDKLCVEHLTSTEFNEFRSAIECGVLDEHLEIYTPWWNACLSQTFPNLCDHLCCKNGRTAHISVVQTVLQAIYALIHLLRRTNGDWQMDIQHSQLQIMALSKSLFTKLLPANTIRVAMFEVLYASTQPPVLSHDLNFNKNCLLDLIRIISFRDFSLRAISPNYRRMSICWELLDNLLLTLQLKYEVLCHLFRKFTESIAAVYFQEIESINNLFRQRLTLNNSDPTKQKKLVNRSLLANKKLLFLKSFVFHHWDILNSTKIEIKTLYGFFEEGMIRGDSIKEYFDKSNSHENSLLLDKLGINDTEAPIKKTSPFQVSSEDSLCIEALSKNDHLSAKIQKNSDPAPQKLITLLKSSSSNAE